MIQVVLVTLAILGLYLQLAAFTGQMLRRASEACTCRDFAWDPACPVHGRKENA